MLEITLRLKENVDTFIKSSFFTFYSLLNVVSPGLDPNPIELTSSDDGSRPQPPQKRVKHTHKKPFSSEVIDLCSESEDVITSPRHKCARDEGSVVVLSTDEEADLEPTALSHSRKTDTRESPTLPPLRDISPPIEIESVLQASPPPLAHNSPVLKPKASVSEEDGLTDENNIHAEKFNLARGSLQVLYNEALARCTREAQREKVTDQPSPFSSLKCVPPARTIRYATQTQQSPRLHTPLFFSRNIFRLRARLKQPKTLSANAFSDAQASFSNSKVFPHAKAFPAFPDDTGFYSIEVSKLNEDQDTLTYSDAVMEISAVDGEALEIAAETTLMPPVDFQDDTSYDTQVVSISPSILANNMDVNERVVSRSLGSPSPLPSQESPLRPEATILENTRILRSIQAQRVSTNCRPTTPDRANSFAISPIMNCNTPLNSDAVNYPPQEAEASLFGKEKCVDQVTTLEPIVLKDAQSFVQALRRKYDASKIYGILFHYFLLISVIDRLNPGFSLHHALELNDIANSSTTFDPCSELPTDYATITNSSSVAISSSVHAASVSKCLPELSMEQTLNLSSPASPSSEDVSSGLECLSESPTVANLPPLASSSSGDTLSSRASSPSPCSRQSLDSSATIESVNCHLLTPNGPPSPLVKVEKQEPLICSKPFSSPIDVSFFDIDMSELNLQTIMCNMFDGDDDDDDISISGMELAYPEELHTI